MTETPLVELMRGRKVCVLTGAGCSTESGIPDYRGPGTRERARNPIQHRAFLEDAAVRARYWARATLGWQYFSRAEPNAAHLALASLERAGVVNGLITQNVDRLHHAAGSQTVIELHGALAEVRCLACGAIEDRAALQQRLLASNPDFTTRSVEIAPGLRVAPLPDGDAELANVSGFAIPACLACDGILKPNVVFFGDSVPRARVDAAFRLLDEADVLLVVGSSLAVFSGYRFVLRAAERSMPIGLVNVGETRADTHARVRVDARAGEVLPALARALVG